MKSTGIVRQLDQLNRIVIPKELVRTYELAGASMEVFTDGDAITLRKYKPGCTFCGTVDGKMIQFGGQLVCEKCTKAIGEASEGQKENR